MDTTVRSTVVPDEGEAEILCRMLRAAGIRCAHFRTNSSSGGSDASASFGGWREIVVLSDDLARARALLPGGENKIRCAECGREITEGEAELERWGYWSDGVGELHPFCPGCAEREFGLPPSREPSEGTSS